MKKNRNTVTDILLLIIITVIAYLPVSAFIFSLKNDSLVQYLPFRYHLSESIQHGYFPFWNPYLYTGFPIHADMQGMTWNPIVLTISLLTRYNMSVLEFEVVIYLVLAAIGMYSLLKSFSLNRVICLLGGISYMSCGFITGSASVIPWISSAAFIPFVFTYLKKFLEHADWKSSITFSISLSLLFLCGYPTFFIYTSYILLSILLFVAISFSGKKQLSATIKPIGLLLLAALLFLCICSPAIISYWEFLPYYSRGGGISVERAAQNPFTPFSAISFVVPNAVSKNHNWLNTDTSMRNSYVGLFVFLLFTLSLFSKSGKWQKFILGFTIFSFLLSLGSFTPLHSICYSIIPLFDTFRHPGNIRLFTSIGIILLAALYGQQVLQQNKATIKRKILRLCYVSVAILGLVVLYCLLQAGVSNNIVAAIKNVKQPKVFLDEFTFTSFLLFQSLAQIIFIFLLIYQLKKQTINRKIVAGLFVVNSVLFCWIALPFNFVSQIRTTAINQYVQSFEKGYPLPAIDSSVEANISSDSTTVPLYGYANFYNKKITIQDYIITPTLNKDYEAYNADKKLRAAMTGYPFAWLNDTLLNTTPLAVMGNKRFSLYNDKLPKPVIVAATNPGTVTLTAFNPNSFSFKVNTPSPTVLSVFQQYNHNWKVKINESISPVLKMNIAFIGVQLQAGDSDITFEYRPANVLTGMWISGIALITLILFFILSAIKSERK